MKLSEKIGKTLTQLRLGRDYTQLELSKRLGIAQTTYAGYETGRHEPSITTLTNLANIYGVSLDYIACRYDDYEIEELPASYMSELIYMNSDDRRQEDIFEMIKSEQEKKFISTIRKESKRSINRVKRNKTKEQKTQ